MKRIIAIILAAIMVFSMAACAAKQTSDEPKSDVAQNDTQTSTDTESIEEGAKPVTINLWSQFSDPNSTDGNYIAFYEALDALKTAMPEVNVVHEGTEQEAYKVKMKTSMPTNFPMSSSTGARQPSSPMLTQSWFFR